MSAPGVIGTIGLVVVTSEAAALKRHSLSLRPVIGGFILGLFLFPFDSANPALSRKVQILIVISALLMNGSALFSTLAKAPLAARKDISL